MTVIARGAAQVRAYEHAMGGDPPKIDIKRLQWGLCKSNLIMGSPYRDKIDCLPSLTIVHVDIRLFMPPIEAI
jgi:hypothetical protein